MSVVRLKNCDFYVLKKKRKCRMLVKETEKFCCEHQPTGELTAENTTERGLRIPCPYDRKHTCFSHKLKKHLKICNSRPKENQPFIVKGVNCGDSESYNEENKTVTLCCTPVDEIKRVIDKINKIFNDNPVLINEDISTHEVVEKEMSDPIYGEKSKKHLKQVSSVLGLLSKYKLLGANTCFIEFGAGRGALSYWISKALCEDTNILLIEKASPKHKKDNKLDKSSKKIERVRVDIKDLVLDELELVNKSEHLVGVTKHLCGAATDFTIRCLMNLSKNLNKLSGFLMTFCCHHRCSWSSFTGREYFEELGINEEDFKIMCGLVSWATCGTGLSRPLKDKLDEKDVENSYVKNNLGLSTDEKLQIGIKCKNLMNWGRLQFIKKVGFECELLHYIPIDITPENVCIVAIKKEYSKS